MCAYKIEICRSSTHQDTSDNYAAYLSMYKTAKILNLKTSLLRRACLHFLCFGCKNATF